MTYVLCLLCCVCLLSMASMVQGFLQQQRYSHHAISFLLKARSQAQRALKEDYIVGENIPEELLKLHPIYDMILVERFSEPERTTGGLFLPKTEGRDRKQVAKVVAIPNSYGLESENGRLQTVEEIMPYKVGDIVVVRVSLIYYVGYY